MSVVLTPEQIIALAPDAGAAKAGKELANSRKWVSLGCDDRAVWGECQGSGASPYQTKIDLSEPAFSCSCPSRKFPCKHSLGLFLLRSSQPDTFSTAAQPAWVTDWLEGRARRAEQKAKKAEQPEGERDPEQARRAADRQAKSAADREAKVAAGLEDLRLWIRDLARRGLGSARDEPYSFWENPAARMIDAQAPGIARMLREMAGVPATGDGWQGRLLERLAKLHLLLEAHGRLDQLPPDTQADVRALIGWTQNQDDLLVTDGIRDRWIVLGQRVEEEGSLRVQRRWLWGEKSERPALVLHFAHTSQPLDASLVPGTALDADLVFFPSAAPLRALVKLRHAPPISIEAIPGHATLRDAVAAHADVLARNPWLERFPFSLRDVVPIQRSETWIVRDSSGMQMPIDPRFTEAWNLVALSGGQPLTLTGEWDGDHLTPLAAWVDGRLHSMS
jgi:hypothetical protein